MLGPLRSAKLVVDAFELLIRCGATSSNDIGRTIPIPVFSEEVIL